MKTFALLAGVALIVACAGKTVRDEATDYLALRLAAAHGDELLTAALLERGAPVDPLHIDAAGELTLGVAESDSPLQLAAENGHTEVVRLILKHNPWVDRSCCNGPTALGYAAMGGHVEIVRLLLQAGADPSIESDYGTPLEVARRKNRKEVVKVLEAAQAQHRGRHE